MNFVQEQLKKLKINVKMPHVNKKLLARKRIVVQTLKKFYAAKPLAFLLHFLFRCDQNHNLTSKIMKMCEQILKIKKTAPEYNSNS